MQEQESGSPSTDNDPVDVENHLVVDTHTADFLVQHTTNGKKVICLVYFSATNMN